MKGRSHRLPSTDPPDDWGDGSWTVDCVCGVTFDDGEEMVNCDECGVWVHTRCSRFVKGETSFACDKCKSKKLHSGGGGGGGGGNENNEETEVAQLLVELPTKTVRMEPPPPVYPPGRRAALRLWTEMPVEERVHVQGVPGGDPALFQGLSSVFTSELWKCAGYVPKKFNFQYREFPCWEESENPVDKGAGVLFSLSKEGIPSSPSVGLDRERKVSLKGMDGWEGGKSRVVTGVFMQSCVKERSQLRQGAGHIGKRKKEDAGTFKDGSGKKKARHAEKEAENKRGRTPAADSHKSELSNKELSKVLNTDFQDLKGRERRENSHLQINAKPELRDEHYSGAETKDVVKAELPTESSRKDNMLPSTHVKSENLSQDGFASVRQSPGADTSVLFVAKVEDEEHTSAVDVLNNCNGNHKLALRELGGDSSAAGVQSHTCKPAKRDDSNSIPDTLDIHMPNASTSSVSPCSRQPNADLKFEVNVSQNRANMECPSSSTGDEKPLIQYARTSSGNLSQYLKPDRSASSQDHRSADLGVKSHMSAKVEVSTSKEASHIDLGSESKTNKVDDSSKLGNTNLGLQTPYPHKLVGDVSKTSPSSSTVASNKSAVTAAAAAVHKPSMYSVKQRLKVNVNSDCKKESVATVGTSTDDKVKGLAISGTKAYHSPRNTSLSCSSKHGLADAKEESYCRSFKAGRAENTGPSDAREDATLSRLQGGRVVENKLASSALPRKCEKISQSSSQLSTKVVDQSLTVPASASPNISDEEFALLLHHQLNSSPRVSRVPRLRQASNMAQLASSTSVGMPMKRTSNSGGKDHSLFSRKKRYKEDLYRDAIRTNREQSDEIKKSDRLSLTDQRQKDSEVTEDGLAKRDSCISPEMITSGKNSAVPVSNDNPTSAVEAIETHSLFRKSSKSGSDDDATVPSDSTPRTLPGLINEIMSKGRRMTYEELCDAVLPHWHNLRKHNGERYAYASHSQAVLDCLRNRSEWSQLVDRGPKTTSGRKKRKHDSDMRGLESDDEDGRDSSKLSEVKGAESQRDEYPKGKRNVRKRRLATQGRGLKDVRKRLKADATTDEDFGASSPSSEGSESFMSEDESQNGDETSRPVDSDASSSSSDEA